MIRPGLHTYTCPQHASVCIVIPPHAGGSASYFRNWGPVVDNLGMELYAAQYPGHEELLTAARASFLDELAEALVTVIGDQAEWTVLLGHSIGGLLVHRVIQSLVAENNPPQALHVSATGVPDQPVAAPRHVLNDRALISSIGEMFLGEGNPLEDEDLVAVLFDQVKSKMRLAEIHRCEPIPLPLPIILHLATEDPDFTLTDVSVWDRLTARGTRLITHPGHHFYFSVQQATVLRVVVGDLPTTLPSGKQAPRHPTNNKDPYMFKYKNFETLDYTRDIIKSWTEEVGSPAIIDNTDFLAGHQRTAIAKTAIDVMETDGTQHGDVVAPIDSDILARIPVPVGMFFGGRISSALAPFASVPSRRYMLNESGARLLLVDHATQRMVEEVTTSEHSCSTVREGPFTNLATEIGPEELPVHADCNKTEDWNTLRYTSGSISTPKGVLLTHRLTELMTYNYISCIGGAGLEGRFLYIMPLSSLEGCGMAQTFATLGLVPCTYRGRAIPAGTLSGMERYRIAALFLPPSQMAAIARDPSFETTDPSVLKSIVYAGQTISPTNLNEAIEVIGGDKLLQAYGQTEAEMLSAPDQVDHCSGDPEILNSTDRLPLPKDIKIRDDDGNVVPKGASGEIFVRGDYINSARWIPEHPWVPAVQPDGWVATIDMARQIRDRIRITGRERDMVFYRDYNVPTRSIEKALQCCEGMLDVVVHPVEDPYAGKVVFTWPKLNEDATVDKGAISNFVQANVSEWSRPSYIEFTDTSPQVSTLKETNKVSLRRRAEERLAESRMKRLKGANGVL